MNKYDRKLVEGLRETIYSLRTELEITRKKGLELIGRHIHEINRKNERIADLEAAIIKVREIESETNKWHGGIEDFAAIFGVALNEIAEVVNGVLPVPDGEELPHA